ncbi:MAG: DUF4851 domain-containing protein [Mailhella sp.]|nr:DUF4851 domain-containing protein [Mailhella sp.]
MKRVLPVLAFLILALPAPLSAGWSLVRGSGPLASFESSARPAVAVKASPELRTVAQGKMTVLLHEGRSLSGEVAGTVWYCLSAREGAQLVVALADAGENEWYPGIMGSSTEASRILYSCGSEKPGSVTQRVFIRSIGVDPWMGAFDADDMGWTASVMVSQYEWLDVDDGTKLLVEYREPCAAELCPVIEPDKLQSFLQRANTSFSARFAKGGTIDAASIAPYGWNGAGISSRLLSDSLGATVNSPGE